MNQRLRPGYRRRRSVEPSHRAGRFARVVEICRKLFDRLKRDTRDIVLIRVVLLIAVTIFCGVRSHRTLEQAICGFDPEDEECAPIKGQPAATTAEPEQKLSVEWVDPEKRLPLKATAEAILKQSEQFQSWEVLVLTGIIAVLITTKVHRAPGSQWAYLALGPAAIYIVISLKAGWTLLTRYTFLISVDDFSDWPSLSALLVVQSDLFLYAIISVSLFAAWFLLLIIMGKVVTSETKS